MAYGYYRRPARPRVDNDVKQELLNRIETVAGRGVTILSDWERGFLQTLRDSASRYGRMTERQHDVFKRIENKTDPEQIKARGEWRETFTPEMRDMLVFAAKYYKANPPYFGFAADRILEDKNYMPTEKLYRKMVENKYVQRALKNSNAAPKYEVGSMITVRNSQAIRHHATSRVRGKNAIVIEVEEQVNNATKGARKVTILPIGAASPIVTEERWLKPCRTK